MAKVTFTFLSLFLFSVSYASDLTNESIKQVISRVDNAINSLNAQEVANVLAKNVEITLYVSGPGGNQVMHFSKQSYVSALQKGWATITNYKYARTNTVIKVQGEKALVSSNIKESMTVQGQPLSANSKEEVIIELVEGKPLVTKVTGYASM